MGKATTKKAVEAKIAPEVKEVKIDRRMEAAGRRETTDRRKQEIAVADERRGGERRVKTARRRQIDPTTCEREYNTEEIEFMHALDAYKRTSGRMFPTCSEILEVIRGLGYVKVSPSTPETTANTNSETVVQAI